MKFRHLLGMLQKEPRVNMHKLNRHLVLDLLAEEEFLSVSIVTSIDSDPLPKTVLLLLLDLHLLDRHLLYARVLISSFQLFLVPAPQPERIVVEHRAHPEHHVPTVEHVRVVHLRALLDVDLLGGKTI